MLASCSGDRTVRIWQRLAGGAGGERWVCAAVLEDAHSRTVRSSCWSPSGRHLATASFDRTTAVWQHSGGAWENVAVLEGHESEVKHVAWNPNGCLIATCSRDKTVWLWEAQPGNEYEVVDVKHGHSQARTACMWGGSTHALRTLGGRGAVTPADAWRSSCATTAAEAAGIAGLKSPPRSSAAVTSAGCQVGGVAPPGRGARLGQLRRLHQALGGGGRRVGVRPDAGG